MALFRAITTPADLPHIGTGRESGTFDFKETADPTSEYELAKDIAAFANALGGVVLVGAVEDPVTRTLLRYASFKEDFAEKLKSAYESAVTHHCHPQPVVDVVRVKEPNGGDVVAVNVQASPMGPVGVRAGSDRKSPSWTFPLRTTTHTYFMTPTEIAMLMVPEIRRIAILLDQIPIDQRSNVNLLHRKPDGLPLTQPASFVEIDANLTTAKFSQAGNLIRSFIPLDRITSVWKRDDLHWNVAVNGHLSARTGSALGFEFVPT